MAGQFRFSFGPWNIHEGADPFGPPVRKPVAFSKRLGLYKKLGFDAVQFHDDDAVPDLNRLTSQQLIKRAKTVKRQLDRHGPCAGLAGPLGAASWGIHRAVQAGMVGRSFACCSRTDFLGVPLGALAEALRAANRRYLDFIGAIDDPTLGMKRLDQVTRPVRDGGRTHRGFNLFHGDDLKLIRSVGRGEFTIGGFQNRALQALLPGKNGPQISRMLKRLRTHGLIKKVGRTYKYYLTRLGRSLTTMALKMREMFIIPSLNRPCVA